MLVIGSMPLRPNAVHLCLMKTKGFSLSVERDYKMRIMFTYNKPFETGKSKIIFICF